MPTNTPQTPQKNGGKGYGKRPLWFWIVIYLIIAIVVYGAIYLLFIHKSGTSGNVYTY